MKYIRKKDAPPKLKDYKTNFNATYEDCDKDVKEAWEKTLLEEQGYLCAYTMQRIKAGRGNMKKEHFIPQKGKHGNKALALDHNNVLAVCMGNEGKGKGKKDQYADTRKGDRLLDDRLNPTNPLCEQVIQYNRRGKISSSIPEIDKQICDQKNDNSNSILNLNHQDLVNGRLGAWEAAKRKLTKGTNNSLRVKDIDKLIIQYQKRNREGKFMEYCNFVLYRLEKERGIRSK